MYVGLQIITIVKMIQGWMTTGGRQHQMAQLIYSQPNPDHCDHFMN